MPIKVLINPESGAVRAADIVWLKDHLTETLGKAGYTADFIYGGAIDLQLYTQTVIEKQVIDLIICVGGDGTTAAIAQALLRSSVPLLPLPGGTMNLFVRDLGISDNLSRSLSGAINGNPKKVDVGMIDDRVFLNNVVFGAYAEIADAREDFRQADGAAETVEAIVNVADAVFKSKPVRYVLTGPDIAGETVANIFMIANNLYTGADLLRPVRQRIDSGKLGVYLAESNDGPDLVMRVAEALAGRLTESQAITISEARDCMVTADGDIRVAIDGDPVIKTEAVKVRSVPGGLTVITPMPPDAD